MEKKLKIAVIGSRGVPAKYGGFETFVEKLAVELANRSHEVHVYGLKKYSTYSEQYYKGIRRILMPSIYIKSLEKFLSSLFAVIHASFARTEIILLLGVSGGLFAWMPRLFGKKLVINIDGLEWRRAKWGKFVSFALKMSERYGSFFSHAVIADSRAIKEYYEKEYKRSCEFIPYGADVNLKETGDSIILEKYGLKQDDYLLQVCRLEPENNTNIVIREYLKSGCTKPLVILGHAPYENEYIRLLHEMSNDRVKFLGAVYGSDYRVISRNALCYIHAHEVGGTNPALLEAMASNNCVLALDVPYNLEVIGDAGECFSKAEGDLAGKLKKLSNNSGTVVEYRRKAFERVQKTYNWMDVINAYENVCLRLLK